VKTKGKFVQEKGLYCTQVLFLRKAGLGFFHFLEIVRGWLVPSTGQKIPLQPGWYLPPQKKLPLAENRFLHAGKGAENTKEKKSRQCFMDLRIVISMYFPPTKSKTKVHKNYYYNNNNKEPQHCNTTLHVPKT
jgi:hypothetical protein